MNASRILFSTLALVPAVVLAQCPCKPLPALNLPMTDGKKLTTASVTQKPTIVVFLKPGCPANPRAIDGFKNFVTQLGSKVKVVGVIGGSMAEAKAFQAEFKPNFAVAADASGKTIEGMGGARSWDFALICSDDKKVAKLFSGFGAPTVKEFQKELPNHGGPKLSLSMARMPAKTVMGCSL